MLDGLTLWASPQMTGRPTKTPVAPSASAFRTSVPRRIPPSTNTSHRPRTAFTTCGGNSQGTFVLFCTNPFLGGESCVIPGASVIIVPRDQLSMRKISTSLFMVNIFDKTSAPRFGKCKPVAKLLGRDLQSGGVSCVFCEKRWNARAVPAHFTVDKNVCFYCLVSCLDLESYSPPSAPPIPFKPGTYFPNPLSRTQQQSCHMMAENNRDQTFRSV